MGVSHPVNTVASMNDEPGAVTVIDCEQCVMQHTAACRDCVVTFICDREPGEAVVVDVEELRSLRLLNQAGLVPELRHHTA